MADHWHRSFAFFGCLWLVLAASAPVRAQSFGPPVPTELILVLLDRHGNQRFTLGMYSAFWENPFRVTVRTDSPALISLGLNPVVSRKVSLIGETSASPLFEGTYALSARWSVGFWYNPIHDRGRQQIVQIADTVRGMAVRRDAELADLHVTYYAPHGRSAQLGYYYESGRIGIRTSDLQANPTYEFQRSDDTLGSWNLWLTQRWDARSGSRLITPFVSLGYHSSSSLGHASSILTGVAVTFNARISLSGSFWLFDLAHPASRITGGLVYRL